MCFLPVRSGFLLVLLGYCPCILSWIHSNMVLDLDFFFGKDTT